MDLEQKDQHQTILIFQRNLSMMKLLLLSLSDEEETMLMTLVEELP